MIVVQPLEKYFKLHVQVCDCTDKNSELELPSYASVSNFIFMHCFLLIL